MEKVTLIYKGRVTKEMEKLNRAEKNSDINQRSAAVASAKKLIRNVASITDLGCPTVKDATSQEIDIYRRHLRDVGENTFVFDQNTIITAKCEIAKLNGGVK